MADDALFFGFGENVHDARETLGPVAFGEAMHKANVDVINAQLAAETVQIGTGGGGVARPGFGEDSHFIAGHVLESFGNVRMAAVRIGGVEEAQTVVVAVEKQAGESVDAECGLVGMMAGAIGAGTHGEAAGLDGGLAEGNGIRGAELTRERGERESPPGKYGWAECCGTGCASGAMDEFAAIHKASLRRTIEARGRLYLY